MVSIIFEHAVEPGPVQDLYVKGDGIATPCAVFKNPTKLSKDLSYIIVVECFPENMVTKNFGSM